jgi:hypothetical protein
MDLQTNGRVLCLHAAAKRLGIPERTLRYRASRGRIPGAFKQGKLWKFAASALHPRGLAPDGVAAAVETWHERRLPV